MQIEKPELFKKRQCVARFKYRKKALEAVAGRPRPELCEVCGNPGQINFDHCHKTLKFRGWICTRCNLTLGRCEDSPAFLRALADYLEKNS
jgi:hypothetical protein